MTERPKRYRMNDFNLDDDGSLRRGSLEKNDGIVQSHVNYGWVPSNVRRLLCATNVRFALEWCAPYRHETGLARLYSGPYLHEIPAEHAPPVPFGWALRRCEARDAYELAPWWYFLPRDLRTGGAA